MTNWDRSRAFYVNGLGFKVDWEHRFEPGFPVFAQVSRDGLSLFLTEHEGDCNVGGAAYVVVDDVDALFREIHGRDVNPVAPPEDAPWGRREMLVVDPDGNRLRFANPEVPRSRTHD
jgi:catechol 2,3-dioxygenase-like lactoylglutathione lyase family enzyme